MRNRYRKVNPKEIHGESTLSGDPLLLAEIGDLMGVTREGVRQIEVKALRKLRQALRKRGITELKDIL
jgi:DNA-directed RNA polymerase sigma subunit (sigma70/sigma32)